MSNKKSKYYMVTGNHAAVPNVPCVRVHPRRISCNLTRPILLELVPPPSPFGVLVLRSRVLPLRVPVFSKDCGDTPRAFAHHLPPSSSSSQALSTTTLIWASALLPTTPPNLVLLAAREGYTTTTPTSQPNSRPHGTIQTGCPAPTTSGESPFNNLQHTLTWFLVFPPIPAHHLPSLPSRNCVASQVCLPFPTSLAVLTATHCMEIPPPTPLSEGPSKLLGWLIPGR